MNTTWREIRTIVGEVVGVLWMLAIIIGFGYCVASLPRNCREVTPRHWRCE